MVKIFIKKKLYFMFIKDESYFLWYVIILSNLIKSLLILLILKGLFRHKDYVDTRVKNSFEIGHGPLWIIFLSFFIFLQKKLTSFSFLLPNSLFESSCCYLFLSLLEVHGIFSSPSISWNFFISNLIFMWALRLVDHFLVFNNHYVSFISLTITTLSSFYRMTSSTKIIQLNSSIKIM